jgi:hypothetical protein
MDRREHLAWCKQRALEYCDAGDLQNAVASMGSDLLKHPETARSGHPHLLMIGVMEAASGNEPGVRRWITGFN